VSLASIGTLFYRVPTYVNQYICLRWQNPRGNGLRLDSKLNKWETEFMGQIFNATEAENFEAMLTELGMKYEEPTLMEN